jgi:hypothetical protein
LVPVEFARQSEDGRITLVIDLRAEPIPVLWAHMLCCNQDDARTALRDREGIRAANWESLIGSWERAEQSPSEIPELPRWAQAHDLDGIVWTALPAKFNDEDRPPSAEEVVGYLRGLSGNTLMRAREYVERAPRQIDTAYRRRIEAALGWSCKADCQ